MNRFDKEFGDVTMSLEDQLNIEKKYYATLHVAIKVVSSQRHQCILNTYYKMEHKEQIYNVAVREAWYNFIQKGGVTLSFPATDEMGKKVYETIYSYFGKAACVCDYVATIVGHATILDTLPKNINVITINITSDNPCLYHKSL